MTSGRTEPRRFGAHDVVAGVSVALLLVPQAMAYAELAGLPPRHGLYAAAVGPIAAAFLASSPWLQTGPGALTALLTFGAVAPLAAVGSAEYVMLAALLALVVGVGRVAVGWIRAGWLSYLMSRPMLDGFTSAAAVLIIASQLPGALGVTDVEGGVVRGAFDALASTGEWDPAAVGITVVTIGIIRGVRRIHPLVPGVVVATVAGLGFSIATGYTGAVVGTIDAGLPVLSLGLPFSRLPELLLPGLVIAVVGFAEAASIARVYAARERVPWSPNREFLSQGAANLAAGVFAGMPLGGSFARSSLNYGSGARTRWSGLVTGLAVLVFLPFAGVLTSLPVAVLAGIVISAVAGLVHFRLLIRLWSVSRPQSAVGWLTFAVTLFVAPRIEQGVLFGIAAALAVHVWRELRPGVEAEVEGDTVHIRPTGVLWFGSLAYLERALLDTLVAHREAGRVVFHLDGLGRIDVSGALLLEEIAEEAEKLELEVELVDVPDHAKRVMASIFGGSGTHR